MRTVIASSGVSGSSGYSRSPAILSGALGCYCDAQPSAARTMPRSGAAVEQVLKVVEQEQQLLSAQIAEKVVSGFPVRAIPARTSSGSVRPASGTQNTPLRTRSDQSRRDL